MTRKQNNRIPFPHPGETIREDLSKPLKLSINTLALDLSRFPSNEERDTIVV